MWDNGHGKCGWRSMSMVGSSYVGAVLWQNDGWLLLRTVCRSICDACRVIINKTIQILHNSIFVYRLFRLLLKIIIAAWQKGTLSRKKMKVEFGIAMLCSNTHVAGEYFRISVYIIFAV